MKNNKTKILIVILGIILLIAILLVYYTTTITTFPVIPGRFTGIITEVSYKSPFDGTDSITVDDKWIIINYGGDSPSLDEEIRGNLIGFNFSKGLEGLKGKRVEVYTKQTGLNSFTIYGDLNYYVKVLD